MMPRKRSSSLSGRQSLLPRKSRSSYGSRSSSVGGGKMAGGRTPLGNSSYGNHSSNIGSKTGGGKTPMENSRKSVFNGRPAGKAGFGLCIGQSRRSSVMGYGNGKIRDERPVKDSHYKEKSIRLLIEFLVDKGYPHPLSLKMLHSPLAKDFMKIFEFMVKLLWPGFGFGRKAEEDVPDVLKILGYPFVISKTAMYAVGSPHTWPTLLASLTWIREQIQYAEDLDVDKMFFPPSLEDPGGFPDEKIFFDYRATTYHSFFDGADSFEEQMEELARLIRNDCGNGSVEDHQAQNRILENELQSLLNEPDQVLAEKEFYSKLQVNKSAAETYYRDKQERHHKSTENKNRIANIEIPALESELESLLQDNKRKQQIKDTQEFSQADLQRMNQDRQVLSMSIESAEKERRQLEEELWSGDITFTKLREQAETKLDQYRQTASNMKLIPSGAKNAQGFNLELPPLPSHGKEEVYMDNLPSYMRSFVELRACLKENTKEVEGKVIATEDLLEQMSELSLQEEQEIRKLDAKQKRITDAISNMKQVFTTESEQLQHEIDQAQSEVNQCQVGSKQDAVRRLEEAKMRLQKQTSVQAAEMEDRIIMMQGAVNLIMEHKEKILEHTQSLVKDVEHLYDTEKQKILQEGMQIPPDYL